MGRAQLKALFQLPGAVEALTPDVVHYTKDPSKKNFGVAETTPELILIDSTVGILGYLQDMPDLKERCEVNAYLVTSIKLSVSGFRLA